MRLSSPTTEEEEHREKEEDEDEDEEDKVDKVDKEEEDKEEDERGSSKVTVRLSSPTTGSISSSATTQALMKACTYVPVPASIRLTLEHPRHPLWMECPFIWTLTSRGCLVELYCQAMALKLGFKYLPSLLLMETCLVNEVRKKVLRKTWVERILNL